MGKLAYPFHEHLNQPNENLAYKLCDRRRIWQESGDIKYRAVERGSHQVEICAAKQSRTRCGLVTHRILSYLGNCKATYKPPHERAIP